MAEPTTKRRKVRHLGRDSNSTPINDPRFTNIQSDPRYRLPSKRHTHVKLDNRFSRILKDEDFIRKARVDRYGRPVEDDSERRRLKRRYEFEDDVADDDVADDDGADDDEEVQKELERVGKIRDVLREGAYSGSESSDESTSDQDDEEDEEEEYMEKGLAEHLEGNVPTGEVSSRIAVVNLDWDNIRAQDLMAVFSSFLPPGGKVLKVAIYPSEFGRERMEREEMEGPPQEIFQTSAIHNEAASSGDESEQDEDTIKKSLLKPDEGEDFDSTKLREYQLERLRYYYAVLTFSSTDVAKTIYDTVDGTEYLSTANIFDLRFIPDETDFSSDKPREECETIPDDYKPNDFMTNALQSSKVKLTWDAEDGSRKEAQARAFRGSRKDIDENDLKAYLASDSSDDEETEAANRENDVSTPGLSKKEKERQKFRALLGLSAEPVKPSKNGNDPVGDVQITFSSGLGTVSGKKGTVFENEPEIEETTMEKYVRKERERKRKRKEKLKHPREEGQVPSNGKAAVDGVEPGTDEQDLGFDDPFFVDPENEKSSASKMRKEERLKKKAEREAEERANATKRAELELLMVDDKDTEVRHFDMNEIEKAEKRAKKKGKRARKEKAKAMEEDTLKDDFTMDTTDPRFARVYENHDFAIDPTNPKFKPTTAMNALLEEGRKRRREATKKPSKIEDVAPGKTSGGKAGGKAAAAGDDEVHRLVEKIRNKRKL